MPEDPVHELRELVDSLSDWLRYQRRLGWRGLPGKIVIPAQEGKQPEDKNLEEIRAEMGDCRRCKLYGGRTTWSLGTGPPTPG